MRAHCVFGVFIPREIASDEIKESDSQGPDVNLIKVAFRGFFSCLRSNEIRLIIDKFGDHKVNEDSLSMLIKDDVGRFDVSVCYLGNLVAVVEGLQNVNKVPSHVTSWLNLAFALVLTD